MKLQTDSPEFTIWESLNYKFSKWFFNWL